MADEDGVSNQPIVIDNGSGLLKAGLAGESQPSVVFSNVVGHKKHELVFPDAGRRQARPVAGQRRGVRSRAEGDAFVGPQAMEKRGVLRLSRVVDRGVVQDWDRMNEIWGHLFSQQLRLHSEEHAVLLTEAPFMPLKDRQKAAEIMFESFNVPAVSFALQAVLSLYAARKTTGVVVDSGDGVTQCVPVCEGFPVQEAISRTDVAGCDVTSYLQLLLRKAGYPFHTTAEHEIVREIKEKCCYVSADPLREEASLKADDAAFAQSYTLPDGNEVRLDAERYRASEVLFRPSVLGSEYPGVHEQLWTAVSQCDLEARGQLYSSIVLAGGTTCMLGYGKRLLSEMVSKTPTGTKIRIFAPPDRQFSPWVGGSVLASLPTFQSMLTSRKQFQEDGTVIHRKVL